MWILAFMVAGAVTFCNCESGNAAAPQDQNQTQNGDNDDNDVDDNDVDDDDDGGGTKEKDPDFGEFVLTEAIDFYGNTYATHNAEYAPAIGKGGLSKWTHPGGVVSTFFRANDSGTLNVALYGKAAAKGTRLNVTVAGKEFIVNVDNTHNDTIRVGQVSLPKAGYVRVDLKGQSSLSENFGTYTHILAGGPAARKGILTIPLESSDNWIYWGRRGPSVHMKYTKPAGNIRYFYNEMTVPEGNDVLHSYFMSNGFTGGYMGMQVNDTDAAKRRVLFSVWSAYSTDNPKDIPEEYRIVMLRKGSGVRVGEFGNEGSGGQSYLLYPWQAGKTYKFLTEVRPDGVDKTIYTGYFCGDDGQWRLIASFMRPDPAKKKESHYEGMHSFLENFGTTTSWQQREVCFGNQWARTAGGEWIELTEGTFTYDNTAAKGIRLDYGGGMKDGSFYLRNCGFFDDNTAYGSKFTRPAKGVAPDVDFDLLESIPSAD